MDKTTASKPLSAHAAALLRALGNPSEWKYTGLVTEDPACQGRCACGQQGIRFEFHLIHADRPAVVGSTCVDHFKEISPELYSALNAARLDLDEKLKAEKRAAADAVMAGARTLKAQKITLGPGAARYRRLRIKNGLAPYNLRVIVSGSGSIDPRAEIFKHRFSPIVILTTGRAEEPPLCPPGFAAILGGAACACRPGFALTALRTG